MTSRGDRTSLSALKLALLASRVHERDEDLRLLQSEPVAIVGMGCRLPGGVETPGALWDLLASGQDAITEVPSDRWDAAAYYDSDPAAPGKINTRYGGFLKRVAEFDPLFFGIAPKEAVYMDPQHRLLLEVAWDAFDDAGLPLPSMRGTDTGVFFALYAGDYGRMQLSDPTSISAHTISGATPSMAAGRLSYLFDLRGPSMVIDTACSSSLVVLHEAVQSLQRRETTVAVAGGVNLILSPEETVSLAKWGMLAPDGRCKTFDARANGFVRSEGCALVVLKRLADALRDGDRIHAVIRGTAINQDGRSSVLTAPNGEAQRSVIRAALQRACVDPNQVTYVETHGTGTKVGDPIEVEALIGVLGELRADGSTCHLGAIKANIGHLETAAGVAGLIKTVLCLQRRAIPPQIHFDVLNPLLSLEGTALRIPTALTPWDTGARPRIAGLSSFGFSGTNAHVILEESPQLPARHPSRERAQLLPLSAKSPAALTSSIAAYVDALHGAETLADVCFTAGARRAHHSMRAAVVAGSRTEMREALRDFQASPGDARTKRSGRVVFVYSGQGSGAVGMASGLLRAEPVFASAIAEADAVLNRRVGWSVSATLQGDDASWLKDTERYQVVLFAVQVGLTHLWRSWGVSPSAVVGHSIGEIAAAHTAGALDFATALDLVVRRATLMKHKAGSGAMAVVGVAADAAEALLKPWCLRLTVAAHNGPASTTIAGDAAAMTEFLAQPALKELFKRELDVDRAFHSPAMEAAAVELSAAIADLRPSATETAMYSSVTGARIRGDELGANYWRRNVREPVLFVEAARALLDDGYDSFVEVGPHPALLQGIKEAAGSRSVVVLPTLRRDQDDRRVMLTALGRLYESGLEPNWRAISDPDARCVALPAYAWERERLWLDVNARSTPPRLTRPPKSLLGRKIDSPFIDGALFESTLRADQPGWLRDHRLFDSAVMPAAAFIDMALSAAVELLNDDVGIELRDGAMQRALVLRRSEVQDLQVRVQPIAAAEWRVRIAARSDPRTPSWETHFECRLLRSTSTVSWPQTQKAPPSALECNVHQLYERMAARGIHFGPTFRRLRGLHSTATTVHATLIDDASSLDTAHIIHPPVLDACFQALEPLFADSPDAWLPIGFDRIEVRGAPAKVESVLVEKQADSSVSRGEMRANFTLDGADGASVRVEGLRVRAVSAATLLRTVSGGNSLLQRVCFEPASSVAATTLRAAGAWLLLADRGGLGRRVAAILSEQSIPCMLIEPTATESVADRDQKADVVDAEHWRRLVHERAAGTEPFRRVIFLGALDAPPSADPLDAQNQVLAPVLSLLQALGTGQSPELWLVTRGAQRFPTPAGCLQASLWGLGAVIAHEYPTLRWRLIDLDQDDSLLNQAEALISEASNDDGENRVAWGNRKRLVARMRSSVVERTAVPNSSWVLRAAPSGVIRDLAPQDAPMVTPAPGEVVIESRAVGVNFRDVLNALGMLETKQALLGGETVGHITAVGAGVDRGLLGLEVMAFAIGGFRSHVALHAGLVAPIPPGLGYIQAAGLPVAFLTAKYGLERLAALKAGDRVLIHAGTGGVGLAAIQVARALGAVVYATAGSEEKRAYLRSLGVEYVFSSRDTKFTDEIRMLSDTGVDVVLNSLADEFVDASVSVLAQGGRFVELGKRGVWSPQKMQHARPDVQYFPFDLSQVGSKTPEIISNLFREIIDGLNRGDYQPLPVRRYELDELHLAVEHMAHAKHIGKIVVAIPSAASRPKLRADATYLIAGGTGALGLKLVESLTNRGARHVALLSRRAPSSTAQRLIHALRPQGIDIRWFAADVAKEADVRRALGAIDAEMPTLRGVFHLAGLLDDAPIAALTWERCLAVLGPKIRGAWNLSQTTRNRNLDLFVTYSSVAAVLGWPGQGAYAGGNAFLDALVRWRFACGLPALSIAWGAWAVGMAADATATKGVDFAARGLRPMTSEETESALEVLLSSRGGDFVVAAIDGERLPRGSLTGFERQGADHAGARRMLEDSTLLERLRRAQPGQRRALIRVRVEEEAGRALGLKAGHRFDATRPLNDFGLDSLLAVQLANALGSQFALPLPPTLLFDYPSIDALTEHLLAIAFPAEAAVSDATDKWRDMTDDDAEALLLKELDSVRRLKDAP